MTRKRVSLNGEFRTFENYLLGKPKISFWVTDGHQQFDLKLAEGDTGKLVTYLERVFEFDMTTGLNKSRLNRAKMKLEFTEA